MDTSSEIRQLLLKKFKEGMKQKDICSQLNLNKSTVSKLIKKYKLSGSISSNRKGRCGRKLALSMRERRKIRKECIKNPMATARELQLAVGGATSSLTVRSIRNYLRRAGRYTYRLFNCPSLTQKQCRARKDWAKSKAGWTKKDWEAVTFSDETCIELSGSKKETFVRRSVGEKIKPCHTKNRRCFTKRLMLWGCMHVGGLGSMKIIRGTVDGAKYSNILNECVIPFADEIQIFQQDNAPPHKTKENISLLENSVELLNWPAYSPDANPIENLWALLKRKVAKRSAKTLLELEMAINDVWNNDEQLNNVCKSLVHSMPDRIKAIIKSRGGYTKY